MNRLLRVGIIALQILALVVLILTWPIWVAALALFIRHTDRLQA